MRKWKRNGLTTTTDDRLTPSNLRYTDSPESDATEPSGVRIHHADGRVSECALIRDPDNDAKGNAHWIAVPEPGTLIGNGDSLAIDVLPGHTVVSVDAGIADG